MPRVATLLVAVWLFLTGVRIPLLEHALVPQYLVALAVILAEIVALRTDAVRWVSFLAGGWLAVAPIVLRYPGPNVAFNSFLCGLFILVLALHPTVPASYATPPSLQRQLFAGHGEGRPIR